MLFMIRSCSLYSMLYNNYCTKNTYSNRNNSAHCRLLSIVVIKSIKSKGHETDMLREAGELIKRFLYASDK